MTRCSVTWFIMWPSTAQYKSQFLPCCTVLRHDDAKSPAFYSRCFCTISWRCSPAVAKVKSFSVVGRWSIKKQTLWPAFTSVLESPSSGCTVEVKAPLRWDKEDRDPDLHTLKTNRINYICILLLRHLAGVVTLWDLRLEEEEQS